MLHGSADRKGTPQDGYETERGTERGAYTRFAVSYLPEITLRHLERPICKARIQETQGFAQSPSLFWRGEIPPRQGQAPESLNAGFLSLWILAKLNWPRIREKRLSGGAKERILQGHGRVDLCRSSRLEIGCRYDSGRAMRGVSCSAGHG